MRRVGSVFDEHCRVRLFDGTYYLSHIAFILGIGDKGTADIEVIETEKDLM